MRILQLIDTLEPGGAERMAVNYANGLCEFGHESYLVATRREGAFKELLQPKVEYLFLQKKQTLDLAALRRFRKYIKQNEIEIIHAHGTSWFLPTLLKMERENFKLIWHNHFGNTGSMNDKNRVLLKFFSFKFDGVISVNNDLYKWSQKELKASNNIFLFNFLSTSWDKQKSSGNANNNINIVLLANLRKEKNHWLLFKVLDGLIAKYSIKLHCIGKNFDNPYSQKILREFQKRNYVIYHGEVSEPAKILEKMDIGVLVSNFEGLPMALLEYARAGLPVITTDVGDCKEVMGPHGKCIAPYKEDALKKALEYYFTHSREAQSDADALQKHVMETYSYKKVLPQYLEFCKAL